MREFEAPASYTIPEDANNSDNVFRFAKESPAAVMFNIPDGKGGWRDVRAAEFATAVTDVAKGLIASGIELGDRVAIMAATRYEWTLLDFAIWAAGGCTVAIYDSSSAEQARWILQDSATVLLVVENDKHRGVISEIAPADLPALRETLQIDKDTIDELVRRGADLDEQVVHDRRAQVNAASPATLIYTSGTTGRPKGVMLSHANLWAESRADRIALASFLTPGKKTLMFLPLAHVFARAVSLAAFDAKVTVAHTSDWGTLVQQFAEHRPDFVLSVPRVFEKVFNGAKQKAHDEGKGKIFDAAAATAIEYSEALGAGKPGLVLRAKHALFDKLVYGKLRAALGGNCQAAVSGGGPLGARLGHFFRGVGVTIFEGYGLTESTAAVSVNTPDHIRVGSVGRPLEGHGAKIGEDGELLLRGPVIFAGYWGNEQATADAFVDGWFRTGDLGAIDADGFITITGRKKEILVTAGGKNVSPAPMEDQLRAHPLIGQVMVVGDGKPFIGALITLDPEALPGWKERNGIAAEIAIAELVENPVLVAEVEAAIAETNKKVSKAEQIRKINILTSDWTQETGELTPKMSLKRAVVMKQYSAEVDKIYS